MSTSAKSFYNFLRNNRIEIPIIQRDYAQGRDGKEYLRKTFLGSLMKALNRENPYDSKSLLLDFVYGTLENGRIYPLDGQQRLTTLWLLHWYVALRAGRLNEAAEVLSRFSYETRISSRDFFRRLCESDNFAKYDASEPVTDFIHRQRWFFTRWEQDPTVNSALRMLRGYHKNEENVNRRKLPEIRRKNRLKDGIEKLFADVEDNSRFVEYWESLISDNPPIEFYHLPLEKFGLTDDLYVKMNARGKELTFFENFKADLIGYIRERASRDSTDSGEWKALLDPIAGIPIRMDTDWSDIFWKLRKEVKCKRDNQETLTECNIDEIYYAFINRIFSDSLILAKVNGAYIVDTRDGKERENSTYVYLNEREDNKENPVPHYLGLEMYKFYPVREEDREKKVIPIEVFHKLQKVLDGWVGDMEGMITPPWEKQFDFLPQYTKDDSAVPITTITQLQRIVFFAVCKYLCEGEYEEVSFRRWMRIVHNLIFGVDHDGNYVIRSIDATRNAMEYLDKLKSHNIYQSIVETGPVGDGAVGLRAAEEIDKVRIILDDEGDSLRIHSSGQTWEEVLTAAERRGFFRGSVRCLIYDADGNPDWSDFDTKLSTIEEYFSEVCPVSSRDSCLRNEVTEAMGISGLMKSFFRQFNQDSWAEYLTLEGHRTFNNRPVSWSYYLLNPNLAGPVHRFLMKMEPEQVHKPEPEVWWKHGLYLLSQTMLLDFVMKRMDRAWIRNYYGHYLIYPSSPGVFLDAEKRDSFMAQEEIEVFSEHIVPETDLLFGVKIKFRWQEHLFEWNERDEVSLIGDESMNYAVIQGPGTEKEAVLCFSAKNMEPKTIMTEMENLVEKRRKYEEKEKKSGIS
ncbi:MAG: DUF262 domain-containing protein [Muribaculaceae bacterium]|nr:DUF262 domain-containing protein [Muribaculaceae bacterium]